MSNLDKKIALVTSASRGIGRADVQLSSLLSGGLDSSAVSDHGS